MKVFFLIQRFEKPSSRYRVLQYLPPLRAAGIDAQVAPVSGRFWGRLSTLRQARHFPVVFIQKKLFHPLELSFLQSKGAKLIYDFDDAVMLRHVPVPGASSRTRARYFAAMVGRASTVLAGNRFLALAAQAHNRDVVPLPTTVDTRKYRVKRDGNSNGTVTLGWLGSPSTLIYLEQILPALREIFRAFPKLQLKVVSSRFPKEEGIPMVRKLWSEAEEEKDLHSFDIGLAPLDRDLWCEGKCGLKLLQYLACGIPTVASPGGAQKEIVQDGVNGFLAQTPQEWVEKIKILLADAQKRKALGLAGRETVEKRYSLDQGAETLVRVIHGIGN